MPSIVARYIYRDEQGNQVNRVSRTSEKDFYIHHWNGDSWVRGANGRVVPYKLPEVLAGIRAGKTIYIVEGEQDVDTAFANGLIATCNFGGAGKWTDDHSKLLIGANRVVIVWDRDDEGAKHAWKVYRSLTKVGVVHVSFKRAASGKDLTDHFAEDFTVDELVVERPAKPAKVEKRVEPLSDSDAPLAWRLMRALCEARGPVITESGKPYQFNGLCPAHDDHSPSLSINYDEDRGRVTLKCQANCDTEDIVDAFGLAMSDLFIDVDDFKSKVEERVKWMEVKAEADIEYATKHAGSEYKIDLFDNATGKQELELALDEPPYMIEGLFLENSRCMLVAEAKSGKTRFCLSLAKAMCDDEPFLGRQVLLPPGARVLYLNGEMHEVLFRTWFKQAEFKQPDRFIVKHFNGQTFPFWREDYRERLADWIAVRRIGLIIFDTQVVFMRGMVSKEEDNLEVSRWHQAVDDLRRACGDVSVLVPHHMGRSDEVRSRGASSMDAWPESLWYLKKRRTDEPKGEPISQSAPRTFFAGGRIPAFAPIDLAYSEDTGLYTYEGISAGEARKLDLFSNVVQAIDEYYDREGHWPKSGVAKGLVGGARERQLEVLHEAVGYGKLGSRRVKNGVEYFNPLRTD